MISKSVPIVVSLFLIQSLCFAGTVVQEKLNYSIVLPDHPSAVCKLAGAELAHFLEKTYQQPISLNGSAEPVTFYVGVSGEAIMKGFANLPDMRGKFGVFLKDRRILCHGGDDEGVAPEKQNFGEAGTLLAVYYFLSQYAGVGFYFPGENGFAIQNEKELNLAQSADIASASFEVRGFSMNTAEFSARDKMLFFHRSLCSIPRWARIDSYYVFDWEKRFWESRPDYFMLRNGKKVWEKYPYFGLCLSNPELVCQAAADIVEDLNKNPHKTTVKLFPDQPLNQCQCLRCAASLERSYAGLDSDSCEEFYGTQKRIADIVHQSHPGIYFLTQNKGRSYYKPPRLAKLDDSFAFSVLTNQHTAKMVDQAFAIDVAKMWRSAGFKTTFFGYPRWSDSGTKNMPVITPRFLAEYFRAFHGLSHGTQISELRSNPYSFSALNQFLQAKLLFDIRADVNALIQEFCAFAYPGAETEMVEFYNSLEALYLQREDVSRDAFVDIYQPENLAKPLRLLDMAKAKVAPGSLFFAKLHEDFAVFYQRSLEAQGSAANERERLAAFREKLALIRAKASHPPTLTLAKGVIAFEGAPDTWTGALRCELLSPSDTPELQKTTAYLACDSDFLYLGLVAAENKPEAIRANCQQDDSLAIFGDDCMELLLLPSDSQSYYQIGINSAGHHTVLKRNRSPSNSRKLVPDLAFELEAKAEKLPDGWVVKAKIPLAQLAPDDLKKPWRFNVYRSRFAGGKKEAYGVMLLSNNFHQNFEFFSHLIFPKAAAK